MKSFLLLNGLFTKTKNKKLAFLKIKVVIKMFVEMVNVLLTKNLGFEPCPIHYTFDNAFDKMVN